MKVNIKMRLYTISIMVAISLISCNKIEKGELDMKSMKFYAYISNNGTKTYMGDERTSGNRPVLWHKGDTVGICNYNNDNNIYPFLNISEDGEMAVLDGQIKSVDEPSQYIAVYPHGFFFGKQYDRVSLRLPQEQNYKKDSFDNNTFPMIAVKNYNEEFFTFKHLCGVISIPIVGSASISKIEFKGYDAYNEKTRVSGDSFFVYVYDYQSSSWPVIEEYWSDDESDYLVTLMCPEGGVALDTVDPTYFYIVLPPKTYNTFEICITSVDGKSMIKKGTNPLVISKSEYRTTQVVNYVGTN